MPVTAQERKFAQDVYVRVCRDSGFSMGFAEACHLTAQLLQISTMELWVRMGLTIAVMDEIATGVHPICKQR